MMTNIDEISTPPDAWAAFDTATRDLRKWQEATPEGLDVEQISNPFVIAALKVGNAIYDARRFILDSEEIGAADGDYREALIDMVGNAARLAQLALVSVYVDAPDDNKPEAAWRHMLAGALTDDEDIARDFPPRFIAALQLVSQSALELLSIVERLSVPMGGLFTVAQGQSTGAPAQEARFAPFRRELLAISSIAVAQIGRILPIGQIEEGKPGTVRKNRQRSRQRRKVAHVINMEVFESELALLTALGLLSPHQWEDADAVAHAVENLMHHATVAFPSHRVSWMNKYRALSGRRDYILRRKV